MDDANINLPNFPEQADIARAGRLIVALLSGQTAVGYDPVATHDFGAAISELGTPLDTTITVRTIHAVACVAIVLSRQLVEAIAPDIAPHEVNEAVRQAIYRTLVEPPPS